MKIITVCRAGLVRSVALADVLKLHFKPVDVIPVVIGEHEFGQFNSPQLLENLFDWADRIIVMETQYKAKIPALYQSKVMVCEVGPDLYGSPKNADLIDICWNWTRENQKDLQIREHFQNL